MNLQLQLCCTYAGHIGSGAPEFDIPKSILEDHLEEGFTIEEISCMRSVSRKNNLSQDGKMRTEGSKF